MSNSRIVGHPAAPATPAEEPATVLPARRASAVGPAVSVLDRLESGPRDWKKGLAHFLSVSAVSLLLHVALLTVMWFVVMPAELKEEILSVIVEQQPIDAEELVVLEEVEMPEKLEELAALDSSPVEISADKLAEQTNPIDIDINDQEIAIDAEISELATSEAIAKLSDIAGGRSEAGRAAQVSQYGGTSASEAAVASGLKWLESIQRPDGSWSFDQIGKAPDPGSLKECHTGATAMALLCYLGAGHTHEKKRDGEDSPYRNTVAKGLNFLLKSIKLTPNGGDLRGKVVSNEGMYVQGLCAIVLCEAAAMTNDRRLHPAAEAAIRFIVRAQNPDDGGWRYRPYYEQKQVSDTSVVGWQMMALKSAMNARIKIPPQVFRDVDKFLDSVQDQGGATYGYTGPPGKPSTTAVGLLCRMYLGWKHDNEAMKNGIAYLSKTGPDANNVYYNYYASQVLRHWGADAPRDTPEWDAWEKFNAKMRDHLVNTQIQDGPAAGTWDLTDPHAANGGRLYQTCLSVMILEVYYRHLPIYDRKNIQVEF